MTVEILTNLNSTYSYRTLSRDEMTSALFDFDQIRARLGHPFEKFRSSKGPKWPKARPNMGRCKAEWIICDLEIRWRCIFIFFAYLCVKQKFIYLMEVASGMDFQLRDDSLHSNIFSNGKTQIFFI